MGVYGAIRQRIIGRYLDDTTDYYEKAKILLTYNLSVILILLVAPITLFLLIVGLYINAMFSLIAVGGISVVIFILCCKRNIKAAAIFYLFISIVVLSLSYLPYTKSYVATNEVWFIVVILYTFFTLGTKWGLFATIIAVTENLLWIKFFMYENLHNEEIYSNQKIVALMVTIPLGFYAIYYIVAQFISTQKYAELELRKINTELEEHNIIIEKQKNEKAAMLKEIHHRVKNNLQIVKSLLKIQSSQVKDENAIALFDEAQKRVISMAMLHENLYKAENSGGIDIKEHFKLIGNDLIQSYGIGKNIVLELQVGEVHFGMRTLVPLGLIVNEIITNSLKYAFVDKTEGRIYIRLYQVREKEHELIIGDDGKGIGSDVNSEKNQMGSELIKIFTEQLNGKIERLDVPGTVYRIVFMNIDEK